MATLGLAVACGGVVLTGSGLAVACGNCRLMLAGGALMRMAVAEVGVNSTRVITRATVRVMAQ